MKVEAILCDMDGVLVDTEKYYMDGTFLWMKRLGYQGTYQEVCTLIGTSMEMSYNMIYEMLDRKYSLEELRVANEQYFYEENPLDYAKVLKETVVDFLKIAKTKGIKTALCSSSPMPDIQKAIDQCHLAEYFDYVVSGDQFVQSKPNPEIYLHAKEMLGAKIENCLVIEDSYLGISAGKNAGMKTVAICDKHFGLVQKDADALVNKMIEINDFIVYL